MTIRHYWHLFNRGIEILETKGPGEFLKQLKLFSSTRGNVIQQIANNGKYPVVTFRNLTDWTLEWCDTSLPRDFDVVVAIPRGGMLIGAIIAQRFGLPLSTPADILNGVKWQSKAIPLETAGKRVLLVDDWAYSGDSIKSNADFLAGHGFDVTPATLIVSPNTKHLVAHYHKIILMPALCESELVDYRGAHLINMAMDMDGVICQECPAELNYNIKAYEKWLSTVRPLFIPSWKINTIVSCRLEKYRAVSESWLKENGVKYEKLYLWDRPEYPSVYADFALYKAEILKKIKPDIYYESSPFEAQIIAKTAGIPVLCWPEKRIIC
jgi:orotate phosphoribosyltransferase